ncbi:hypothetical protein DPMN_101335 [Dreissena polymorpha]|uniref:Uncharacterized protein n=1 Tax=Dreissena polymorpha TaxID=45954 RepID=A0A9D4LIY1_DREPO|nr:hypothetical protein DPMN_101335 [Dreissena polymorpha]
MDGYVYSDENINFIIVISVVMVVIVAMGTGISVWLAWRRNKSLEDNGPVINGYSLTTDIVDVWSVQGQYNPLAI